MTNIKIDGFAFAQVYRNIYRAMRTLGYTNDEVDVHVHQGSVYLSARGRCVANPWDDGVSNSKFVKLLIKDWFSGFNSEDPNKLTLRREPIYLGAGDELDPLYKYAKLYLSRGGLQIIRYLELDNKETADIAVISYGPAMYYGKGRKGEHLTNFNPFLTRENKLEAIAVWKGKFNPTDTERLVVANQRPLYLYR